MWEALRCEKSGTGGAVEKVIVGQVFHKGEKQGQARLAYGSLEPVPFFASISPAKHFRRGLLTEDPGDWIACLCRER